MNQKAAKAAKSRSGTQDEELPYSIELWDDDDRLPQRVLARAFTSALARAIFQAAQNEHPERRIVLRRGARTVADSAD